MRRQSPVVKSAC